MTGSARGLLDIETFIIPKAIIDDTVDFLREVGATGAEGFVLWAGKIEKADLFRFQTVMVPEQRPIATDRGLLVVVEGEALFALNKLAYERNEILGGQVHTHPTSAYHSDTDDHYPLVTLVGAMSVVLPDFAKNAPRDIAEWAWYRLMEYGHWEPFSKQTKVIFE
jgi:hypothetical protein